MENVYGFIASKIVELRTNFGGKGLTQEELGQKMKTTANTISRWESEVYRPSVEDLHKLSNFFGVSISVFFPDMAVNQKQSALMSATGELNETDLDELIEYAKFRKARTILENAKRTRKKTTTVS